MFPKKPSPAPIALQIGSIGISLYSSDPTLRREISTLFNAFIVPARASFWRVDLRPLARRSPHKTPVVRRNGDAFTLQWSRFFGRFSFRSRSGRLRAESAAVLSTFLRAFISQVLADGEGFLVHSAGLSNDSAACVMPGVSGSGKSTIARLFGADRILSDEIVLLQKRNAQWTAFGTPFTGELPESRPASAPLSALYFLEKSPLWKKSALAKPEAVRRLLRCVINFSDDRNAHASILGAAEDLVSSVPARILSFSRALPPRTSLERYLFV